MKVRTAAVLAALFLLPLTAGCAPTDLKWTEEVDIKIGTTSSAEVFMPSKGQSCSR